MKDVLEATDTRKLWAIEEFHKLGFWSAPDYKGKASKVDSNVNFTHLVHIIGFTQDPALQQKSKKRKVDNSSDDLVAAFHNQEEDVRDLNDRLTDLEEKPEGHSLEHMERLHPLDLQEIIAAVTKNVQATFDAQWASLRSDWDSYLTKQLKLTVVALFSDPEEKVEVLNALGLMDEIIDCWNEFKTEELKGQLSEEIQGYLKKNPLTLDQTTLYQTALTIISKLWDKILPQLHGKAATTAENAVNNKWTLVATEWQKQSEEMALLIQEFKEKRIVELPDISVKKFAFTTPSPPSGIAATTVPVAPTTSAMPHPIVLPTTVQAPKPVPVPATPQATAPAPPGGAPVVPVYKATTSTAATPGTLPSREYELALEKAALYLRETWGLDYYRVGTQLHWHATGGTQHGTVGRKETAQAVLDGATYTGNGPFKGIQFPERGRPAAPYSSNLQAEAANQVSGNNTTATAATPATATTPATPAANNSGPRRRYYSHGKKTGSG